MIVIKKQGNFKKANSYFEKLLEIARFGVLDKYGRKGVAALKAATPKDTGITANSWYYKITHTKNKASIVWSNSNMNDGCNIAVLIQYGHGTGTGAYVEGTDYINPTMKSIFDEIAEEAWKEIKSL